MKKKSLKTLAVILVTFIVLVPAIAAPFMAQSVENEVIPLEQANAPTEVQPLAEPGVPEEDLGTTVPAGVPPAIEAEADKIIPLEDVDAYLVELTMSLSTDAVQTGAVGTPAQATVHVTAGQPSNIVNAVYKGVQVRVCFGAAASYLDLEAAASTLFDVNYERLGGSIETDPVTGESYISYTLGDYNSITKGELTIPLRFKNGITPGGVQLAPVARLYYIGRGEDYQHVAALDAQAGTLTAQAVLSQAGGSVEWYMANGSNSSAEFNDQPTQAIVSKNVSLNGNINVRYSPNQSSALGVLYAKSFNIVTTLTLPKGVSFPEADGKVAPEAGLAWHVAGLNVEQDISGVFSDYSLQKTTEGDNTVYTFKVVYTPNVSGSNPTAFVSSVSFQQVLVAPGSNTSYAVKAQTTAQVTGVDAATTVAVTGTGGAQYTITRKAGVPGEYAFDGDLQNSLVLNKYVAPADNAAEAHGTAGGSGMKAYKDGDTATFTIDEFEISNPAKPGQVYELRKLALYDQIPSNKYLTPQYISFGNIRAANNTQVVPYYISFTIGTQTRTYKLTDAQRAAGELHIDDALIQGLNGWSNYKANQITQIGLLYYNPDDVAGTAVQSNFTIHTGIKISFGVNAGAQPAPAMGQTLQNDAYFTFENNPSWGTAKESAAYNYTYTSPHSNAEIQMEGNDLCTVEVSKTVKNVTPREGDLNKHMLGDTLQYTLTIKNNTYITDRKIIDIEVIDEMLGGYLDTDTISIDPGVQSGNGITVIGSPAWASTAHDTGHATSTPNYTSLETGLTINNVGNSARVVWKFTGRALSYNQTIKIVYTVTVKTAEQLSNGGISVSNPESGLKIENRVWVKNAQGGAGNVTVVGSLVPRPFIEYGITATIGGQDAETTGFDTGAQQTVKYAVTVKNQQNPFEGSSNVTKAIVGGTLPSGFALNSQAPTFAISRSGRPLAGTSAVAISVAGTEAAFSYRTDASSEASELYRLLIYRQGRVYGFSFIINEQAGGLQYGSAETFTLTFEADTTQSISDFLHGAPRQNFETQIRLAIWDAERGDLNAAGGEPDYRYKYAVPDNHKKLNYGYKANSGNWNTLLGSVKGGLQVALPILGAINQPAILTSLSVSKNPNTNAYPANNFGAGDGLVYTFMVENYSAYSFSPMDQSVVVAIPHGQTIDESSIQVADSQGGTDGGTGAEALTPDENYKYYRLAWENVLEAKATVNNSGTYVKGYIRIIFKTTIDNNYENTFANEMDATKDVESKVYLMFSQALAAKVRVYSTAYGGSSQPLDTTAFADLGDIDQREALTGTESTPYRLGNVYAHSYRRARVFPDVRKEYSKTSGIANKDKMTVTITLSNASQATSPLKPGYVVEVLPKPVMYTSMAGGTTGGIGQPEAQIDATYDFGNGLGAQPVTLLVWKIPSNINAGGSVKIVYNAQISMKNPSKLPEYGDKYGDTIFIPNPADINGFKKTGTTDTIMLNPAGDSAGLTANAGSIAAHLDGAYTAAELLAGKAALYETKLQILGSEVPLMWQETSHSTVTLQQNFSYNLFIQNGSMLEDYCYYQNMVIVDRLPYITDIGVTDNKNRGTEFRPTLKNITISQEIEGLASAAVPVSGQSYKVWYLLQDANGAPSNTPYIRTHDIWKNYWTDKDAAAANLTVAGEEWKLASEVSESELANVVAFRIEFHEEYRFSSLNRMIIKVNMQVPDTLQVALNGTNLFKARNTFAFNAKSVSVVSETPKNLQGFPLQENADVYLDAPVNNEVVVEKTIEDPSGKDATDRNVGRTFEVTLTETNTGATTTHYLTSGRDGKYRLTITGLPLGNYVITETKEMQGSGVDINDLYDVRMSREQETSDTNQLTFNMDVISVNGNSVGVGIVNRQKEAKIIINKTFQRGGSPAGITFHLVNKQLGINLSGQTDASGNLSFGGLPWGVYNLIEVCKNGYAPSGFTPMEDQSGAPNGYMFYYKQIVLPSFNNGGTVSLVSNTEVHNATASGKVVVHKTWNSEPTIGSESMPRFLLVPYEATDWNNGVWLNYTPGTPDTPATFTTPQVATGRYWLYEIVNAKYEPFTGWSFAQWHYMEPGYEYLLNRYRYDTVIVVERAKDYEIQVDNIFPPDYKEPQLPTSSGRAYTPPLGPVAPSSSSNPPASSPAGPEQGAILSTPEPDTAGSLQQQASITGEGTPISIAPVVGSWSAFNMILSIISVAISVGNLVSFFARRKDFGDPTVSKALGTGLKIAVVLMGVVIGVVFGGFTSFSQAMGLFDDMTKFVVPLFLFQMVLFSASLFANRSRQFYDNDDEDPIEGYRDYM